LWLLRSNCRWRRAVRASASLLACLLQLLLFHNDELIFANLVASTFLVCPDGLTRNRVYELVPETVAGCLVHLPESYPLARIDRRVQGNRTRHERQL
jgi:hypothetical protein